MGLGGEEDWKREVKELKEVKVKKKKNINF